MTAATTTPRTSAPPPPAERRRSRKPLGLRLTPYLFLLPNMAIFLTFVIYPALNGVNISLYSSSNGRTFRWEGTGNYRRILTDSEFWQVALNTAVYAVGFVVAVTVLAVLLAVLVNAQRRGRAAFRSILFVPVLVSPVVVGIVFNWMLERRGGVVNQMLGWVGIEPVPWLIDGGLAMVSVLLAGLWCQVGFYMLIVMSGLQSIDPSLYEAASIDGATGTQQFLRITLPLLRPTLLVVVVLGTINGFQAFDFIYNLTGGGPVGATTLLVQYIYENGFVSPIRYGLATAGSVLLFLVIFVLTLINWAVGRRSSAV
jgi:alpha-1,4-digalacturonate transport system permease protein